MTTTSALPPGVELTSHTRPVDTSRPDKDDTKQTLCPNARLRIHFEDVSHPAAQAFMQNINLATLLPTAITHVQRFLFQSSPSPSSIRPQHTPVPNPFAQPTSHSTLPTSIPHRPTPHHFPTQEVRSVTLVLESISGVAYTTGTDLDDAHKEIHLSLDYVNHIRETTTPDDFRHEFLGVITHEMVHCFQHGCRGTAPGGLIEGIADFVRLKAGLGAKHWRKEKGEKWDEGYQKTAWFLEWVEQETGSVGRGICELNREMRGSEWDGGECWRKCFGESVSVMWQRYCDSWKDENSHGSDGVKPVSI